MHMSIPPSPDQELKLKLWLDQAHCPKWAVMIEVWCEHIQLKVRAFKETRPNQTTMVTSATELVPRRLMTLACWGNMTLGGLLLC